MIINAKKIVKRYEQRLALDHVSLDIKDKEIYGIYGNHGSGKTSLIHCLLNLCTYDKGTVTYIDGEDEVTLHKIKNCIGLVSREVALLDKLTVYENLYYFARLSISNKEEVKQSVERMLSLLQLDMVTKMYPKKLSEGQLARLNFGCGVVHHPSIIFLDEPVYHIDTASQEIIYHAIKELNQEGASILYCSQKIEEVEYLCHRASILQQGRVVASGSLDELRNMISFSEIITIEIYDMTSSVIDDISQFISIADILYENHKLVIKSKKGTNNLLLILDYMQKNKVSFGKVYTQIPNLSDVILEITGEKI